MSQTPPVHPAWIDRHPRELCEEIGHKPRKSLGQNFLVSGAALDRIAALAQLSPDETVLEIGTGFGRLTARLAAQAGRVVSIEYDEMLHWAASQLLEGYGNVELVHGDFLAGKHRINPLLTQMLSPGPIKVVANLPYGISSPAVTNLLEWQATVSELYVMLQREVADRVTARPGTHRYGALTVCVDYWATAQKVLTLTRGHFWPAPAVDSSVVHIARRPERERSEMYHVFSTVVSTLFSMRRKTLAAALKKTWGKQKAADVLARLQLSPRIRVEHLGVRDFEAIAGLVGRPGQ
jgi:16S rRNA (adenine1518-N6/adenine1519-N6)-dimethyltransferase